MSDREKVGAWLRSEWLKDETTDGTYEWWEAKADELLALLSPPAPTEAGNQRPTPEPTESGEAAAWKYSCICGYSNLVDFRPTHCQACTDRTELDPEKVIALGPLSPPPQSQDRERETIEKLLKSMKASERQCAVSGSRIEYLKHTANWIRSHDSAILSTLGCGCPSCEEGVTCRSGMEANEDAETITDALALIQSQRERLEQIAEHTIAIEGPGVAWDEVDGDYLYEPGVVQRRVDAAKEEIERLKTALETPEAGEVERITSAELMATDRPVMEEGSCLCTIHSPMDRVEGAVYDPGGWRVPNPNCPVCHSLDSEPDGEEQKPCAVCNGSGSWPFPTRQVCPRCHGKLVDPLTPFDGPTPSPDAREDVGEIKEAMTPEQWEESSKCVSYEEVGELFGHHAMAADILNAKPFGFRWVDVEALEQAISDNAAAENEYACCDEHHAAAKRQRDAVSRIIAKIMALLKPTDAYLARTKPEEVEEFCSGCGMPYPCPSDCPTGTHMKPKPAPKEPGGLVEAVEVAYSTAYVRYISQHPFDGDKAHKAGLRAAIAAVADWLDENMISWDAGPVCALALHTQLKADK